MKLFGKMAATALVAATAMSFAATSEAEARCGFACGAIFGIIGGVAAGAAIASTPPGYPYYAPPPGVYYEPGHVYYQGPVYPGCRKYKWVDQWGRKHVDQICG